MSYYICKLSINEKFRQFGRLKNHMKYFCWKVNWQIFMFLAKMLSNYFNIYIVTRLLLLHLSRILYEQFQSLTSTQFFIYSLLSCTYIYTYVRKYSHTHTHKYQSLHLLRNPWLFKSRKSTSIILSLKNNKWINNWICA